MHCKSFEGNSGAIELACITKICPHTKHINVLFRQFCEYVHKVLIYIHEVSMDDQFSDLCTKLLPQNFFPKHCKIIFGF